MKTDPSPDNNARMHHPLRTSSEYREALARATAAHRAALTAATKANARDSGGFIVGLPPAFWGRVILLLAFMAFVSWIAIHVIAALPTAL